MSQKNQKSVLLVDDEHTQREALHRGLELRGFSVQSAADALTARRLVEQRSTPFDVVVLDMNLKDPSGTTGADLGIEFRKRKEWQEWPVEFLICSAYDDKEYYKLAMELGAAAYLEKRQDVDFHSVTQHVRVLALRRALSIDRPDALTTVDAIAKNSLTKEEAVRRFCEEVLCTELTNSLRAPFLLLATDSGGTYGYTNQPTLPSGPQRAYVTIQALTQSLTGASGVFPFNPERLDKPASREEGVVLGLLRGAVFTPLLSDQDFRISLGILAGPKGRDGDDPETLAKILAAFFRPAVLKHLLTLTTKWNELYVQRMAVLTATSQLCLYVGQEQITLLEEAATTGEISEEGSSLKELQLLAEDLREAGEILGELAQEERNRTTAGPPGSTAIGKGLISMRELIRSAWERTSSMLAVESQDVIDLKESDCQVQGRRDYLEIATSRVLQWFIQRLQVATAPHSGPSIFVTCRNTAEGPEVVFEDHSRRLSKPLREHLFVPFSGAVYLPPNKADLRGPGLHLPLYMAKALIELGNGGRLNDDTPEEGELGNRLVMRFPPSRIEASVAVN